MDYRPTFKDYAKTFIAATITVAIVLGIFAGVFLLTYHQKTPATVEEVWSIIEDAGFEPIDTTDIYNNAWRDQIGKAVIKSVGFQKDDIIFNFFVFIDKSYAEHVRGKFQSYILDYRYSGTNVEVSEAAANYIIYTLRANGVYSVNVRVDNTLVYAYCDEENASKIRDIMLAIDYF